jgi:hypothetical protein
VLRAKFVRWLLDSTAVVSVYLLGDAIPEDCRFPHTIANPQFTITIAVSKNNKTRKSIAKSIDCSLVLRTENLVLSERTKTQNSQRRHIFLYREIFKIVDFDYLGY